MKKRFDKNLYTCCIDTDMGVGIISKTKNINLLIKLIIFTSLRFLEKIEKSF